MNIKVEEYMASEKFKKQVKKGK